MLGVAGTSPTPNTGELSCASPRSIWGVNVSTVTRVVLGIAAAAVVLTYLVIVDLGVSAGRIHRGVTVGGIDVGGLTVIEATRKLEPIGEDLVDSPLVFHAQGVVCAFEPRDLGWFPEPLATAQSALRIGRESAPFGALKDRFRAWVSGVEAGWADKPAARKVTAFIDECEQRTAVAGAELNRGRLRFLIKQTIGSWPYQQTWDLPVVPS